MSSYIKCKDLPLFYVEQGAQIAFDDYRINCFFCFGRKPIDFVGFQSGVKGIFFKDVPGFKD